MNKKVGYTLIEILIAATVFVLFIGSGIALYLQGQGTISKSSWINNSTKD